MDLRFVLVWSWIITFCEALAIVWLLYHVHHMKKWISRFEKNTYSEENKFTNQ